MATEIIPGPLGEIRGVGGTGTSISTTAAFIQIPDGTRRIYLTPRNFSTAVVVYVGLNPYLTILKTADALATNPTDYSGEAQDGSTSTSVVLSSLDTAANNDYLYVGSHEQFRGVAIDVDAANGTSSTLTVKYRKSDNTWADISATDGTASGGATMAQDGNVTWTVPSDWIGCTLRGAGDTSSKEAFANTELYWTRWEVSAALDSSTTLDHMLAMNRVAVSFPMTDTVTFSGALTKGPGGFGCIEVTTDAGTANLLVGVETSASSRFA